MKNLLKTAFIAMIISVSVPLISVQAAGNDGANQQMTPAEAQQISRRLEELKSMDVRNMSRTERKELRHSIKSMQKRQYASGGVYLSAGAVILLVILLIILL